MTLPFELFLNSPLFLLLIVSASLTIKVLLLLTLVPQLFRATTILRLGIWLIAILLGSISGEIVWATRLTRLLFFPEVPYSVIVFLVRIGWCFFILEYQALGLFIENLIAPKAKLNIVQKIIYTISSIIGFYYLYLAFFGNNFITEEERAAAINTMSIYTDCFEITLMRVSVLYILPFVVIPSLIKAFRTINNNELPKILHHQFSAILRYLILPYLMVNFLIGIHFESHLIKHFTNALMVISVLLISVIAYYCIRKIMYLRFLNFTDHVYVPKSFNFVNDFKVILEQLSLATTMQELVQLTTSFFKDSCNIPARKVSLYLRSAKSSLSSHMQPSFTATESIVEEFLSNNQELANSIKAHKILIYDEIAFTNFYETDAKHTALIAFLTHIQADVFLPIFEKQNIIGYIIIGSNARPEVLYSNIERDEMLVFTSYLSNIINLLHHRNFEGLMAQEKELEEELYKKNLEISQYKESIRSFIKNGKQKSIGIIFYKQRRFIFANQMAKEMIKINLNTQEGHPLTRALKQTAQHVQEYKAPQTITVKDTNGMRMVASGVLNLEQNNVIITLSYPDISDIITKQVSLLKDPSKWDYVLYLETTKPGQLINQLIPGNGETLLNFKISLLQTALSKKATALEMPAEDLVATVDLLHHISMRETLHTMTLTTESDRHDIALKLFGINPIYGTTSTTKPILERLNGTGTLFIKNIDLLDLELQDYLAEFIQCGLYRMYKSDRKIHSDVRIICSTTTPLQQLMHNGQFSTALFNELKKTCLTLPPLHLLPENELQELVYGYTQQAVKTDDFRSLLELNEKDKSRFIHTRPISLSELKIKVQHILQQKSKKNNIEQEVHFDPAYDISDPELIEAGRLGKQALRDHKLMVMLWNKFKNQNKIATFLGVNRSSVNRRCKAYNLEA